MEARRQEENVEEDTQLNLRGKLQKLLADVWSWYPAYMLKMRVRQCKEFGEDMTRANIDGDPKLARKICGRPVAELAHCGALGLYTATPCSCEPAFKKRRCMAHDLTRPRAHREPEQAEVVVGHRRRKILRSGACAEPYDVQLKDKDRVDDPKCPTRWIAAEHVTEKQLDEYWHNMEAKGFVAAKSAPGDLSSTSCATHKESTATYRKLVRAGRLGGWLVACTSNGKIVHAKEFVGAESISPRYFFLAELAQAVPELEVLIHDDACHLRRFATNRMKDAEVNKDLAKRLAFPSMKYVIDKLHAKGHVDAWCVANCVPDSPGNAELLKGFKTSVCETMNSVIGRRKFALRNMKRLVASFFMTEAMYIRNTLGRV